MVCAAVMEATGWAVRLANWRNSFCSCFYPVTGNRKEVPWGCGPDYAPMLALDFDYPGMYPRPGK